MTRAAPSYYVSPPEAVVLATATLFEIRPDDLKSARRTKAIADGRRVVRLVMLDMGYTASQVGAALNVGEGAVWQWGRSTEDFHVEMAREVSKELAP